MVRLGNVMSEKFNVSNSLMSVSNGKISYLKVDFGDLNRKLEQKRMILCLGSNEHKDFK